MGKKIIIVDDEEIILSCLKIELEESGYEVTIAPSGEEGLALIRKNYFDLLVTDLMMEGIGGLELLKSAKKVDPDLSVIILTGYGEVASAVEALRLGASDYLLKPCDCSELQVRIDKCFEQQEMVKKIKVYERILSLCSKCRKVLDNRTGKNNKIEWIELDQFISRRSGLGISHGYCPDCYHKAIEEIEELKKKVKKS